MLPAALRALLPAALHLHCTTRPRAPGDRLFRAGRAPAAMHYVAGGDVALQRVGRGGELIELQRVQHGFVAQASLDAARYHCEAVVLRPSQVTHIPLPLLRQTLQSDAAFAMRWIALLSQEVRQLRQRCERLSLRTVEARLRHLIDTEGGAHGWPLRSDLKSLARELGVTHEALYRCLADLQRRGELSRGSGRQPVWRLLPARAGARGTRR